MNLWIYTVCLNFGSEGKTHNISQFYVYYYNTHQYLINKKNSSAIRINFLLKLSIQQEACLLMLNVEF